jgi:hypothetical protein
MKLLINQIEYKRLLELKFRLKRKAHVQPLTPLENLILENCEEKLATDNGSLQYLMEMSTNPDLMVG